MWDIVFDGLLACCWPLSPRQKQSTFLSQGREKRHAEKLSDALTTGMLFERQARGPSFQAETHCFEQSGQIVDNVNLHPETAAVFVSRDTDKAFTQQSGGCGTYVFDGSNKDIASYWSGGRVTFASQKAHTCQAVLAGTDVAVICDRGSAHLEVDAVGATKAVCVVNSHNRIAQIRHVAAAHPAASLDADTRECDCALFVTRQRGHIEINDVARLDALM
eukprot:Gregarina_sp_Pseudo_9__2555@NODE_2823_length_858_cov_112_550672_g2583_i0_p1_GENE_NODE_2823_length_858_cov_112_550672_g2583_i0NODE_2823_length_858_cov_112_550672_g2583_i0_p1_ORF_typecomplete_len219_score35_29R2K_2/PF18299_1/77R2K_2/PF18299_1/1_8_NODE_2823_length_858_cov_112_550672_g2583_i081737